MSDEVAKPHDPFAKFGGEGGFGGSGDMFPPHTIISAKPQLDEMSMIFHNLPRDQRVRERYNQAFVPPLTKAQLVVAEKTKRLNADWRRNRYLKVVEFLEVIQKNTTHLLSCEGKMIAVAMLEQALNAIASKPSLAFDDNGKKCTGNPSYWAILLAQYAGYEGGMQGQWITSSEESSLAWDTDSLHDLLCEHDHLEYYTKEHGENFTCIGTGASGRKSGMKGLRQASSFIARATKRSKRVDNLGNHASRLQKANVLEALLCYANGTRTVLPSAILYGRRPEVQTYKLLGPKSAAAARAGAAWVAARRTGAGLNVGCSSSTDVVTPMLKHRQDQHASTHGEVGSSAGAGTGAV